MLKIKEEIQHHIRLLLVDDHQVVRSGLRTFFGGYPELEVVGEAANVGEAVAAAGQLQPAIVLMDLRIPGGGGIAACSEIRALYPHIKILFLSAFGDEESVFAALLAGAQGYVLKEAGMGELVREIKSVARGMSSMDYMVARQIANWLRGAKDEHLPDPVQLGKLLTTQELRIIPLVTKGKTNKQIAVELNLSPRTVKNYLAHIFEKLQVSHRSQVAALFAKTKGT